MRKMDNLGRLRRPKPHHRVTRVIEGNAAAGLPICKPWYGLSAYASWWANGGPVP
jgi:hypothetical protein